MADAQIRVFLADDHALFREGAAALLAGDGDIRIVGQCGDGLEVLALIHQTLPDVVILDISMPGLNGLDLCRELTQPADGPAILMVTMHANEQCVIDAIENGAAGYLLKESASTQFREAIHAVARGEVYLGTGIPRTVLAKINRHQDDPHKSLTHRERQVLQMIAEGKSNRQVAMDLGISPKTVDTHRVHLMQKLDIHNLVDLVKYAIARGLVTVDHVADT